MDVQLQSKFDRGFFIADNDWTCYRRNYFQVSATFNLHGYPLYYHDQHDPELGCLVRDVGDDQLHPVNCFMVGISAHVVDEDKRITLIQHTAKRDKGPQKQPEPKPIRPGGDLALLSNMAAATATSTGNTSSSSTGGTGESTPSSQTTTPVSPVNQSIVTFERIQFKSATANNGKRRAAQQYYVLMVELYAKIASGKMIRVATTRSAPLVVRGRSPGHYSERREESTAATLAAQAADARRNMTHTPSSSSSVPPPTPRQGILGSEKSKGEQQLQEEQHHSHYPERSVTPPPPPHTASSSSSQHLPQHPSVQSNGYYYQHHPSQQLPPPHSPSLPMIPPPPSASSPQQQHVVMRAHDRSISAPSGSVDVYNNAHNGGGGHDMNRYGYYQQRDTWNMAHARMASSGEAYNMPPPPPPHATYGYYPYTNDAHSRHQSASVVGHHYYNG